MLARTFSGVPPTGLVYGLVNTSGGHLVAHGLEDFEFLAFRQARGGKFGAFEVARDALVLIEEDLLVHLLEVERVIHRKAQAPVLELVAPRC